MADPIEPTDPLEALALAHTKRMQEISDEGFLDAKEACDNIVTVIRKFSGLKSKLVERALENLGITPPAMPAEAATDAPTEDTE